MEHYSTADGDRIRIDCREPERSFADDVALAVSRDPDGGPVDGVVTTGRHADAVHELFRTGAAFDIRLAPADEGEETVFEGCTLLSSSGKWTASREP